MNAFVLLAAILQSLAVTARNPYLGYDAGKYADLLDLLAGLALKGNSAVDELRQLRMEIDNMLEQRRAPTTEEVDRWKSRSDAAHEGLQRLKDSSPADPGDNKGGVVPDGT
jgi:FtsZ-binding cell division protein ZapB